METLGILILMGITTRIPGRKNTHLCTENVTTTTTATNLAAAAAGAAESWVESE
jgi:hypothetical protein